MEFPGGATAALTILDDADHGTRAGLEPIYDLLHENGLYTTRSTFVLPQRQGARASDLTDQTYRDWLLKIQRQGFEICIHNVGNGVFVRPEIESGLHLFQEVIGRPPIVHCNHSSNPDNLYWSPKERFSWPISWAYSLFGKDKRRHYWGAVEDSPFYWADLLQGRIKYVRNLVFNAPNTLKMDPYMPYWDPRKPLVPFWFSSTDMRDPIRLGEVLTERNLDQLCAENGACIGYTHFGHPGFLDSEGKVSADLRRVVNAIRARNIWVAPVSTVLEHLLQKRRYNDCELGRARALRLSIRWAIDRFWSRR
jgi:hypothetical protein